MKKRLTYKVLSAMVLSGIALNSTAVLASGKLLVWEDIKKSIGNEAATKAFEKKYDVEVNVVELPYGGQVESLRMDGPAGTGPDVITLPHDQIGSAAIQGLLSPMKVDESITSIYTQSALDALTYKRTLYGLPKAVETLVMVYNKDKLAEPPKTLDEALAISKKARENDEYGMLAKWDEIYYAYGVVKGMGGDIFGLNADGSYNSEQILLNSDGAVKAGQYIEQFYKSGVLPSGIIGDSGLNAIDSLFTAKKASMVITGPWAFQPYKEAGVNIGIAPLPKLPNGEPMSSFLGVKSNSISIYSKNKELAQKYIEFINNYDNSKVRFEKTGEVPAVSALVNDPVIKNDEGARAVAMQAEYAVPMPSIPEMNEVWAPANSALQLIATGKQEPKAALDNAVQSLQMQIEANHAMMGQ
ncbi:extracellular solute-binding protein [Vibrio gangliei]|uniref:extracellular solute-binding protein n=1 Tax=Vibrio gangliei TaxID=2077090 RepID=UPI000D019D8E|nr:extracellular solute-binding protein [Vibrio gangliei]